MLHEFLEQNKEQIFVLCRKKILKDSDNKVTSETLEQGLPLFYSDLIDVLARTAAANYVETEDIPSQDKSKTYGAASHGKESLKLGYTISQVVHAYGAVCQSITEVAELNKFKISTQEFHQLNRCLDTAIAEAVTEFEKVHDENVNDDEVKRMGYLVHEMRNVIAVASISYTMIQKGQVGSQGSTSKVLGDALERMRYLMDRGLTEVRLRAQYLFEETEFDVYDVVSEVEATATLISDNDKINFVTEIGRDLKVIADRQLLLSALSNLVQNAVKFTKVKGTVWLRAKESQGRVLIEVEDQCGGLPHGMIEELFKPFIQKGDNRSGLGLGLALSNRAVTMCHGKICVRDIPGQGCVFTIDLPKANQAAASRSIKNSHLDDVIKTVLK